MDINFSAEESLRRLATELRVAEDLSRAIEGAIGELLSGQSSIHDCSVELQSADRLTQIIGSLAAFSGALADRNISGKSVDQCAHEFVKLHDLADALSGNPHKEKVSHGELDLF